MGVGNGVFVDVAVKAGVKLGVNVTEDGVEVFVGVFITAGVFVFVGVLDGVGVLVGVNVVVGVGVALDETVPPPKSFSKASLALMNHKPKIYHLAEKYFFINGFASCVEVKKKLKPVTRRKINQIKTL